MWYVMLASPNAVRNDHLKGSVNFQIQIWLEVKLDWNNGEMQMQLTGGICFVNYSALMKSKKVIEMKYVFGLRWYVNSVWNRNVTKMPL